MKTIKDKLPVTLGFIGFLLVFATMYYLFVFQSQDYYMRVDNTQVRQLSSTDNMKYEYQLIAYDKKGKPKKINFKTSKILKDGAYLQLEIMITRGVKNWWEVQFDDLPPKVQEKWSVLY